jgi:hypothetical protein
MSYDGKNGTVDPYVKKRLLFGGSEALNNPFIKNMEIDPREHDMFRFDLEDAFRRSNSGRKLEIPSHLVPEGKVWSFKAEYINSVYQRDSLMEHIRNGWQFVDATKVPQLISVELVDDVKYPNMDYRYHRVGGHILAEIDEEKLETKLSYFEQRAKHMRAPLEDIFTRNSGLSEAYYKINRALYEDVQQKITYS